MAAVGSAMISRPGCGPAPPKIPATRRRKKSAPAVHGSATAKLARSILSGMLGLAVRHDALLYNPARDIARIESGEKAARSLTLDGARDLRAKVAVSEKAIAWGLADFTDMMLATGLRVGETSAITWDALDLVAGTVELRGTVISLKGQGLILKLRPKRRGSERKLELQSWAVENAADTTAPPRQLGSQGHCVAGSRDHSSRRRASVHCADGWST